MRKSLKDWWHKELKRMHDEVDRLRKARTVYIQRQQEWERCRDAARIAEQGAELGATGENKVSHKAIKTHCHLSLTIIGLGVLHSGEMTDN